MSADCGIRCVNQFGRNHATRTILWRILLPVHANRQGSRPEKSSNRSGSGFDVGLVFVLCRSDRLVHSAYPENIMKATHLASLLFPECREVFERGNLGYGDNRNVFVRVFDRVRVVVYDNLQTDGSLGANFLRRLGFDIHYLPEPGKIRESFTIDQARGKRALLLIVMSRG